MADGALPPLPRGATWDRPKLPLGATYEPPESAAPPLPPGATYEPPAYPLDSTQPPRMPNYPVTKTAPEFDPLSGQEGSSPIADFLTNTGLGFLHGATTGARLAAIAAARGDVAGGSEYFEGQRPLLERLASGAMPGEELETWRGTLAKDHSPDAAMIQGLISDILEGTIRNVDDLNQAVPPVGATLPMRQRPAFKAWQDIGAWQERNFPATPAYQEGAGGVVRGLAEGTGTVATSILAQLLGTPVLGTGFNILQGQGETLERIYDPQRVAALEAFQRGDQEVQPGSAPGPWDRLAGAADTLAGMSAPQAIDPAIQRNVDEILEANASGAVPYGTIAGLTEVLPLETLINGIPGLRNAGAFIKILGQAGIDGAQEMVAQVLQNWGGQTYDPSAKEEAGVPEAGGLGAGVGAITEAGKQGLSFLARLLIPGRQRGTAGSGTLTLEQQAALDARLQPSTGGRLDVHLPTEPPPPPRATEGTQVLPTNVPPTPATEGTQVLPTNVPPTPATEGTQVLPTNVPPTPATEGTQVLPTERPAPDAKEVLAAGEAHKAAVAQFGYGSEQSQAALKNYEDIVGRFVAAREAARTATAAVEAPVVEEAPPAPPETKTAPVTPPGPPGAGSQVLPTNVSPAAGPEATNVLPSGQPPAASGDEGSAAVPVPGEEAAPSPPKTEPIAPVSAPEEPDTAPRPSTTPPAAEPSSAPAELAEASPQEPKTPSDLIGKPPVGSNDLLSFIISQGGVQPTGDLRAQDAHRVRPGVINKTGKTPDQIREAMAEAGYFGDTKSQMGATLHNDALTMITDALGGKLIYPQTAIDERQASDRRDFETRVQNVEQVAGEIDAAIAEHGFDLTNEERDQAIVRRYQKGEDPEDILVNIVDQRAEPEAVSIETPDEVPFGEAPSSVTPLPSEPGAEGKAQTFIPGTREASAGKGTPTNTAKDMQKVLLAGQAARSPTGEVFAVRNVPGKGWVVRKDGEDSTVHPTREQAAQSASTKAFAKGKAEPKKAQKGVAGTALFGDEHKQGAMPGLEQTSPPVPDSERPTPTKKPEPASTSPRPKRVSAPAGVATEVENKDEFEAELRAGKAVAYMVTDADGKNPRMRSFEIRKEDGKFVGVVTEGGIEKSRTLAFESEEQVLIRLREKAHDLPAAPKRPGSDLLARIDALGEEEEDVGAEPAEERLADASLTTPPGVGTEQFADELDDDIEAQDEGVRERVTPDSRVPRGGLTPTFQNVSMSTDTPMNERAAYEDAGLDPDEILTRSPAERIEALINLFKTKFGFKSVNREGTYRTGEPLKTIDALTDGYRGIRMMMHVLGLPETGASLDGFISLVLGGQTKRTSFLGAYDPTDNSIEMIGRSNSFAHEYMHALDQWLLQAIDPTSEGFASRWTRSKGFDPSVDLEGHFINVMNAIFFDDARLATRVLDLQMKAGKTDKKGNPTKGALEAQRLLDDIKAGKSKLINERSDTYKKAQRFGKGNPYWTNPAEMLARAFEAYVAHKTAILYPGFKSNFISKGDEAYLNNVDRRLAETFPKVPDRTRIFIALDILMADVASHSSLSGSVTTAPTENELLDDDAFYAHAARETRNAKEKARQRAIVSRLKNRLMQTTSLSGWGEIASDFLESIQTRFAARRESQLSFGQVIWTSAKAIFQSEAAVAEALVNRPQSIAARPYMKALAGQVFELDPGGGQLLRQTWPEAVASFTRKFAGRLGNVLDRYNIPHQVAPRSTTAKGMEAKGQRDRLYGLLTGGPVTGVSSNEKAAAAAIRKLYDEIHREATRAGLDIGYIEDAPYLPVIPEASKINGDEPGFIEAATKLYALVFERAVGSPTEAEPLADAIQAIENSVNPRVLNDPAVVTARKKVVQLQKQLSRLEKSVATSPDPDVVQAQLEKLGEDYQDALDELADLIQPLYAEMRAHAWHDQFVKGQYTSMDTRGPQTRHTKNRVLPHEAQEIMSDFYVDDPIEATAVYINAMARKIEYGRRLGKQSGGVEDFEWLINRPNSPVLEEMVSKGLDRNRPADRVKAIMTLTDPKDANRKEMLLMEAKRAGAVAEDLQALAEQIEFMTGLKDNHGPMRHLSNAVYTIGTLSLMPRAWWTSLAEPLTAMLRTGDVAVAGQVMQSYMAEVFRSKSTTVQDVREIATAIGLVASEAQEAMLQVTLGDIPMGERSTRLMAAFYERIGLAGLTRVQKRSAMVGYELWLRKLLRLAQGTDPGNAAVAKADLAELGIAADQIQQLNDFLQAGTSRFLTIGELRTPMGQLWLVGANRFAHSVVQDTGKGNAPRLTSHPMGRLAFGLMRFAYAFTRNLLVRFTRQAERDYALRRGAGEGHAAAYLKAGRDNLLARGLLGLGTLYLGQFLIGWLREWLFNHEQYERHKKEGDWLSWMGTIALSRTGAFGAWDPVVQGVEGITYQRDITALTSGPYTNIALAFVQAGVMALSKNSPNTNTAERGFWREAFRLFLTPAISTGLTIMPGGKYASALYAGAGMLGTSNTLQGWLVDVIAGPKSDGKKKTFN